MNILIHTHFTEARNDNLYDLTAIRQMRNPLLERILAASNAFRASINR